MPGALTISKFVIGFVILASAIGYVAYDRMHPNVIVQQIQAPAAVAEGTQTEPKQEEKVSTTAAVPVKPTSASVTKPTPKPVAPVPKKTEPTEEKMPCIVHGVTSPTKLTSKECDEVEEKFNQLIEISKMKTNLGRQADYQEQRKEKCSLDKMNPNGTPSAQYEIIQICRANYDEIIDELQRQFERMEDQYIQIYGKKPSLY